MRPKQEQARAVPVQQHQWRELLHWEKNQICNHPPGGAIDGSQSENGSYGLFETAVDAETAGLWLANEAWGSEDNSPRGRAPGRVCLRGRVKYYLGHVAHFDCVCVAAFVAAAAVVLSPKIFFIIELIKILPNTRTHIQLDIHTTTCTHKSNN